MFENYFKKSRVAFIKNKGITNTGFVNQIKNTSFIFKSGGKGMFAIHSEYEKAEKCKCFR